MERSILRYFAGFKTWFAYFQYLLVRFILFPDEVTLISYTDDIAPYGANKTNNLVIKEIAQNSFSMV